MKSDYKIKKGFLEVSKLHTMYYEVCGNDNGEPYLFVHGGPGAGFSEKDKRFFDFNKHRVVFFDQRGAAKSTPFGCTEENTTQDLVNDINQLLEFLSIEKINIFGGSWGTTLSLVYAIQYPQKVKSLLLRGVFLGDKNSIDYYLHGGVEKKFPEVWHRFKQNVPSDIKVSVAEYYLDQMLNGSSEKKAFFCYEWTYYEMSIFKKNMDASEIDATIKSFPFESLSIMEAHYLTQNCFIEDNYIMKNGSVLSTIPTIIVHGEKDAICPVEYAVLLHENLKNSTLYIEDAGHSDSEIEIETRLLSILER